ncbi:hypothetical protein MCEET85_00855 [Candidatus Methylopumilus planktonicus]
MRLFEESLTPEEKNCHGSKAVNINNGYGAPLSCIFAILEKTNNIINIVNIGFIATHKKPRNVCLNLIRISLQAKKNKRSL